MWGGPRLGPPLVAGQQKGAQTGSLRLSAIFECPKSLSCGPDPLLGYGRVSTDGQSLTAQVAELKAALCIEIFQEKVSGAKSDRKQLARLIARLDKGDVLVVTRLDRLARSTRDLLNVLGAVAEKGAGFNSLRDT
jgi:hypothetical protein